MQLNRVNSWEFRRDELNHDWLKNQYINSLNAFNIILSSPGFYSESEFLSKIEEFRTWKNKRKEFDDSY